MDYRSYLREAEDKLDGVERALDRLAEGTYGTCEVCSSEITDAELESSPATQWCEEHRQANPDPDPYADAAAADPD